MMDELILQLRKIVQSQAEDSGLWFVAETAPEGYLQQELRKLHDAAEKFLKRYEREGGM